MHRVRAAAHGTEKLHAHLARRHAAGRQSPPAPTSGSRSRPTAKRCPPPGRPSSMTLGGGEVLGGNPKVTRARKNTADARIASPFYKKSSVRDHYNEEARAYDARRLRAGRPPPTTTGWPTVSRPGKRTASWSRTSRSPIPSRPIIRRTPPMSGTSGCSISKGSSAIRSRTPTPVSR